MKVMNIFLMVLMGALAVQEGVDISQHGATSHNVVFCLLFAAFSIRRFMLLKSGSGAKI